MATSLLPANQAFRAALVVARSAIDEHVRDLASVSPVRQLDTDRLLDRIGHHEQGQHFFLLSNSAIQPQVNARVGCADTQVGFGPEVLIQLSVTLST